MTLLSTLLPVLVVTLSPAAEANTVPNSLFCLLCGQAGMANLVRNVLLFVPFGVALRLLAADARWAALIILSTTAGIEASQLLIPGRNPGMIDVSANFTGGVLGYAVAGVIRTWIARGAGKSASVVAIWSILASVMLLLTSQLFRVEVSDSPFFGHHRPELGHLAEYGGRVLQATIDDVPLSQGALADSERVRRAISTGAVFQAVATADFPSDALAPIVMITNGRYEEVLLIGIDGYDLVSRIRYLADDLRFHRPDVRLRGVLEDVSIGDTVVVRLDVRGGASCMSLNDDTRCAVGPYLEEGWSLLRAPTGMPAWMRSSLNFAWMFGLFFPIGLFGRRDVVTAAASAVLTMASFSGLWISSVSPPTLVGIVGMALGVFAGNTLYELLSSRSGDVEGTLGTDRR